MSELVEFEELKCKNNELRQTIKTQKGVITGLINKNWELNKKPEHKEKVIVFDGY
jgi:FtsZ-binding cell division protein ZapB